MSTCDFGLFVVGGGSGGVRAARVAAGHGARVALAEEHRLGGTCVIRGCVPKKLLVYASRFRDDFEDARRYGWDCGRASFNWAALIKAKDKEIARLEGVYRRNLEEAGVTIFADRAHLEGPRTIAVAGRTFSAGKILIATGGRPYLDSSLHGYEHAITSNEAFQLHSLPDRIVVAGGGYIAIEFASIFAGLGAETTLVHRGEKVLRGFDEDLREGVMDALAKRGVRLVMNEVVSRIVKTDEGFRGYLRGGAVLEAGHIMLAIGRRPNTSGLGLEAAGVKTGARGEIIVDAWSQSNVPGIYAVGDVTDRRNLTPVAIREGQAFADTVFGGSRSKVDHRLVPTAVFATPELGTVGLSEQEARQTFPDVDIYKTSFRPLRNTLAGRDERMLLKLVVEGRTGRVVGCHVLGPDATEIVQTAAIALRMGATKADFDATMALHPTAAEELVTMREKCMPDVLAAE